ncbi:MAP7 domain-containing protein 1 isoform X1 [Amyelois transitella]|uniref:MAP7 domain-containing protein 1 isoform X1 n=1 Tax=Amyelois transitella TaxID=680683 RepID=UPI00298F66E7|nr:MAP7 domain-containing protein 1 isoform X1 [Amyelois transitella]
MVSCIRLNMQASSRFPSSYEHRPRIQVKQSRNSPIPIRVERFTERQGRLIKIRDSLSSLVNRPPKKDTSDRKCSSDNISNWYKKHRAAREQKSQEKKERKLYEKERIELQKAQKQFEKNQQAEQERIAREQKKLENAQLEEYNRLQREREKELLKQLQEQEKYLKSYPQLRMETETSYKDSTKNKRTVDSASKKLYKSNNHHRLSWTDRFSHWFYRLCCQFYCYLTCVLLVLFVLIFVI